MSVCASCGRSVRRSGEYHPYAFCVLAKAGLDPWGELRLMAWHLGLGEPPEQPPLVSDLGNIHKDPTA